MFDLGDAEIPRGNRSGADLTEHEFGYQYPPELGDLRPGNDAHERLVRRIMDRARESHGVMNDRYDSWDLIENSLRSYVMLDKGELSTKSKDPRKPVRIVIPVTYATLETLLTYMVGALLTEKPIFPYEPRSGEDTVPVALMEALVEWQACRAKWGIDLHTWFRDAWVYGFGAISPQWTTRHGYRTVRKPTGFMSMFTGLFQQTGEEKQQEPMVLYEGNKLHTIDPRLMLKDPNTAAEAIEDSEFVGWVSRVNLMSLLEMENGSGGAMFNAKYLTVTDGRSALYGSRGGHIGDRASGTTNPVDLTWMYIRLIPAEWKLGPGRDPQMWLFCVAGDRVLLRASRVDLNHNRFPVAMIAPESDGRNAAPISKLEVSYGLQEVIDWMFNSHMANVRNAVNNMIWYDPSVFNSEDLANPEPGKLIRLRRAAWGRDPRASIGQLQVNDITRNHVADAEYALGLLKQVTGTTDIVQGVMREGGERRSATEAKGARTAALSRLEKAARLVSMQGMQDLGYMVASQTQQFMSTEVSGRVLGITAEKMRMDYQDFQSVGPLDILADFDVIPRDGTMPNADNLDSLVGMFQTIAGSEYLSQSYDLDRLSTIIFRLSGVKNADDLKHLQLQPQVMPDEAVAQGVQEGNMVAAEDFA